MADYPALTEMGITRPDEITRYSLRQEGPTKDVLQIYYRRQTGSFLPHSRKYKFGRSTNTMRTGIGNAGAQEVHQISPFLVSAIAELDLLVTQHEAAEDDKERLLADIDDLESSVRLKCADLKARIERLQ